MNSSSAAATNMEPIAAAPRVAARASRPSFQVSQQQLDSLLERMTPPNPEITIADHQRGYCWTPPRQRELVDTVLSGLPIPVIILFQRPNRTMSLEDGRQRLETLRRFRDNEFPLADGRTYADLSVEERTHFDLYPVPVLTYRSATNQQIIDIFNRFQNGSPLSVGERLHSLAEMSPLVRLARRLLLTAGEGFHNRATATWGIRATGDEKKRRKNLMTACAVVAGAAFDSAALSRKWGDFERRDEHGVMSLARDIDDAMVTLKIERLLRIYERVNGEFRISGKTAENKLWNPGTYSGYIIHSLNSLPQESWDELEERWVDFIVAGRRDPSVMNVLTDTVAAARSWTVDRWQNGCRAVFPDLFPTEEAAGEPEVIDDEDEDSDSTE